jgi:hypothetical protein
MNRTRSKRTERNTHSKTKAGGRTEQSKSGPYHAPKRSKAEGVPPTENLKKSPDEAYGDTEISGRARQ